MLEHRLINYSIASKQLSEVDPPLVYSIHIQMSSRERIKQ